MMKKKACDACHRRKIQCDASDESQCNWCSHHGLACTFDRVRGRRKGKNTRTKLGSEKSLSERIGRIEDALARTIALKGACNTSPATSHSSTSPSVATTRPSDESSRALSSLGEQIAIHQAQSDSHITSINGSNPAPTSFGQIHFAGYHLGQINCHNGIPLLSKEGQLWIQSRTGEIPSLRELGGLGALQQVQSFSLPGLLNHSLYDLIHDFPERALVEHLLHEFLTSPFRLVFPVVDRVLFMDTIDLAYAPIQAQPTLEQITSKACILAFVSILCLFLENDGTEIPIDADHCAIKAHYLLSDVLEDASITGLQAVFMLHLHQSFSGRLQSAAMLHGVACRKVLMLGGQNYVDMGHSASVIGHQERERRHLRMLFWLCYIFDKDIALRTGQPPTLDDDYCDLTLPDRYVEDHFMILSLPEEELAPAFANEEMVPHLPGDLRLSFLKGKTCRALYSAHALRKSDAQLLRDIRELDDELESWRLSIPPEYRPALSIPENPHFDNAWKLPQSMQRIALHLEYHHLMTAIHRASGRCLATDSDENDEANQHSGVHSSLALSVEASRSTLFYLKAAVHGLAGEAFWIIVFYPMSALITLFFNILMHPLDPQTQPDIELLRSAADLIRSMPVRKLMTYEIAHLKMVDGFVAELIRLSNCAVSKATRESEQRQRSLECRPMLR